MAKALYRVSTGIQVWLPWVRLIVFVPKLEETMGMWVKEGPTGGLPLFTQDSDCTLPQHHDPGKGDP